MKTLYITGLGPGAKETPAGAVHSDEELDAALDRLAGLGCTGVEVGNNEGFMNGIYGIGSAKAIKAQMTWDTKTKEAQ